MLVDLPDDQIKELARVSSRENLSRAAVIRKAVAAYLGKQSSSQVDQAFGLWREEAIEGLEYQDRLRSEW
jgi:metal-responsive CopG/Arc/MetJ family transcriptional regulator